MIIKLIWMLIFNTMKLEALVNIYETSFSIPQSFCLNNASQVIMSSQFPADLKAYWSFDYLYAIDETGHHNHFHPGFRPGPPFGGVGASAYIYPGYESISRFGSSHLSNEFTIMFWIYTLSEFTDYVGKQEKKFEIFSRDSINISISSVNQSVVVSGGSKPIYTRSTILPKKWTHIAFTYNQGEQQLYVNGMADTKSLKNDNILLNKGIYKLGKKKSTEDSIGIEAYVDELKIFDVALPGGFIGASLPPHSGLIGTNSIKFGCLCKIEEAARPDLCGPDSHLCYSSEFEQFGYAIARQQGFLRAPSLEESLRLWFGDQIKDITTMSSPHTSDVRLALCCTGFESCAQNH